jgi:hypothetical protein
VEILYQQGAEFKLVAFDATTKELHGASAQVSEHPVEKGVNVVDHVRADRKRYSAEVMVTNHPITSALASGSVRPLKLRGAREVTAQANVLRFDQAFNRVQEVLDTLYRLMDEATELDITTAVRQYETMFLVDIGAPRDAGSSNSITFSLEFTQVRFAVTSTVAAPDPVQTRGKKKKAKGAQATKDVKADNRSLAAKLVEDQLGIGLRPGRH